MIKRQLCLFLLFELTMLHVFAQTNRDIGIQQASFFYKVDGQQERSSAAKGATKIVAERLKFSEHDSLQLIQSAADKKGNTHERYQHYYDNIKVENSIITVHVDRAENIYNLSGEYISVSLQPEKNNISERQALERAEAFVGASVYAWRDPASEEHIKILRNDPRASYAPRGEAVIFEGRLAYKFEIYALEPEGGHTIFVDKENGDILDKTNTHRYDDPGQPLPVAENAHTRYSGIQSIVTKIVNGLGYSLADETRGGGIYTYKMPNNSTNLSDKVPFIDGDDSWTEYNNATHDDDLLDAHWGAMMTYDYWFEKHNRASFNGGIGFSGGAPAPITSASKQKYLYMSFY